MHKAYLERHGASAEDEAACLVALCLRDIAYLGRLDRLPGYMESLSSLDPGVLVTFRGPLLCVLEYASNNCASDQLDRLFEAVRPGSGDRADMPEYLIAYSEKKHRCDRDQEAALALLGEAEEMIREEGAVSDKRLADAAYRTALNLADLGRVEEAVGQLETCLQIMKACGYPEDSAHMLSTMNTYATMLNLHGARRKALNMMQRLYAVYERQGRKDTMEGLCLGNNMARTMEGLGQLREAAAWMAEVVKMEETVSVGWQTHAIHLRNYASLLCRTGDFRRAMPYAEEALSPREEGMSADDPAIADARSVLAFALAFPGTSAGHWIWPAQPMRSSWPSPRSTP